MKWWSANFFSFSGDILAKICKDYSDEENVSHSLKAGLRFCAENLSVIQDYRHAQVMRLESKVIRPLSDYGNICKQIKVMETANTCTVLIFVLGGGVFL